MPLNKAALSNQLKETFKKSKDENWTSDRVADELASAIDSFIRSGEIKGITTEVKDNNNVIIGTGTQKGTVNIT